MALCSEFDRQDLGTGRCRLPHEQRAGADEAFLVGKRNGRAAFGGGQRRLETCRACDRGHDPIGRPRRRLDDGVGTGACFDTGAGKFGLQFAIGVRIGHDSKARAKLAREPRQCGGIAMGRHRFDAVAGRVLPQQVDRARPDRAGGAEKRDRPRNRRELRPRQWLRLHHRPTIAGSRAPGHPFPAARCR